MRSFVFVATACTLLLLAAGADAAAHRGIPINLGDTVVTEITPAGDTDTAVFDAHEGTVLWATVASPGRSELLPSLVLLAPSGAEIGAESMKIGRKKVSLKKFVLPETGRYAIVIGGTDGTTGAYRLKTKGKYPKRFKIMGTALAPGGTVDFHHPGQTDAAIRISIKGDGGAYRVVSVFNPEGKEIPGQTDYFEYKKNKARGVTFPFGTFGIYGFSVGDADAPVLLDVTIRVRYPTVVNWRREISPLEPIIERLDPDYGRVGETISIFGQHFSGDVAVTFGDVEAVASRESNIRIGAEVPEGDGIVDVTVYNEDGQEGRLEESFTYIPDPPKAAASTPKEGPTAGGTSITVTGESLSFVEKVTLGSTSITALVVESDTQIRFTTVASPPGLVSLTVEDRWGRRSTLFGAFTFYAPPNLSSITPGAGTWLGGTGVSLLGSSFRADDKVTFGGISVTPTLVDATRLDIFTPGHAKGLVDVTVEDIWGYSTTLPDAFEYNDGTFNDVTSTNMPRNASDLQVGGKSIALGDIDGDDDPDIVIGGRTKSVLGAPTIVLTNDGNGRFSYDSTISFDKDDSLAIALGDLDGDDDLDLVVTQEGFYQRSYYYFYSYSIGTWYWMYNIPYSSTRVFTNDGKGSFSFVPAGIFDFRYQKKGNDLMQGTALTLGDVDGDDDLDLIVTRDQNVGTADYYNRYPSWGNYYKWFVIYYKSNSPATRVLINDGRAMFKNQSEILMPSVKDGDLFAGDMALLGDVDGDDDLDLVLTGDNDNLRDSKKTEYVKGSKTRILLNDGTGVFSNKTETAFPPIKSGDDWGGKGIALGDIDGDDVLDLVVVTERTVYTTGAGGSKVYLPSTRVFLGGSSGFTEATSTYIPAVHPQAFGEMWKGVAVAIADPDGDGNTDIFVLSRNAVRVLNPDTGEYNKQISSARWLFNDATPLTDLTAKGMPSPARTGDYYLGDTLLLGDVDGDDDLDMIISSGAVYQSTNERPTRLFIFN